MTSTNHLTDEVTSVGKYRRLQRLSDDAGRFAMLAIDQRGSLRKMIGAQAGIPTDQVPDEALETMKRIVTTAVAPLATAVLTDPLHGYPTSPASIPPGVGLLLALEVTGYEAAGEAERLSTLIECWSPRRIGQTGADAVKLLLWHRHDASEATQRHQDMLVEQVGRECEEEGLPFVLEVVTYPRPGQRASSAEYTREKPEIVIDAARRFSDDRFRVDLLKLDIQGAELMVLQYARARLRQARAPLPEVSGRLQRRADILFPREAEDAADVGFQEGAYQVVYALGEEAHQSGDERALLNAPDCQPLGSQKHVRIGGGVVQAGDDQSALAKLTFQLEEGGCIHLHGLVGKR